MIMLKNVRLLDPQTRTDDIRDILISEGRVRKIDKDLYLDATLMARYMTAQGFVPLRVL